MKYRRPSTKSNTSTYYLKKKKKLVNPPLPNRFSSYYFDDLRAYSIEFYKKIDFYFEYCSYASGLKEIRA